jgi:hypothetical protein
MNNIDAIILQYAAGEVLACDANEILLQYKMLTDANENGIEEIPEGVNIWEPLTHNNVNRLLELVDLKIDTTNRLLSDLGFNKELVQLLSYRNRYDISIQFWNNNYCAVFIEKNDVELQNYGGNDEFAIGESLKYLNRINRIDNENG